MPQLFSVSSDAMKLGDQHQSAQAKILIFRSRITRMRRDSGDRRHSICHSFPLTSLVCLR